jgi:hypothetical protein
MLQLLLGVLVVPGNMLWRIIGVWTTCCTTLVQNPNFLKPTAKMPMTTNQKLY